MPSDSFTSFRLERDGRGVLTVCLDVPGRPVNVFDDGVIRELAQVVDNIENDATVRVIVFISGKPTGFLAGADVKRIVDLRDPAEAEAISKIGQDLFERIARLQPPTVAVIQGPCLGGGLEFALACRYRLACDDGATRLGLPEVELGILPGWGGTQRLPKLIGLPDALRMILEARKVTAREALRSGLVDQVAPPDEFAALQARFIEDLLAGRTPPRPAKGLLEWLRDDTALGRRLVFQTVRKKLKGRGHHYPALQAALRSVEFGLSHPLPAGLQFEREEFAKLLFTPVCRNLIGLFFQRERARATATWTPGGWSGEKRKIRKVGVVGAGVMGAGIAQLAAFQGLDVILRDVKQEFVDAGLQRIRDLFDESVSKGLLRRDEADARLAHITSTVGWEPFAQAELAIEAVTEDEKVKREVFRALDQCMPPEALLASNTSALSILQLAESTQRPAQVAGLHFFNPVHRMQLVEVVRAQGTGATTIAALAELVRKLGKTPIVVADSPGFLVNRILFPYLDEGVRLFIEGYPIEEIDRQMRQFGMPMGPLELLDQAGIDVGAHVAGTLSALTSDPSPTARELSSMVERGWLGKKSNQGFYIYKQGRRTRPSRFSRPHVDAPKRVPQLTGPDGPWTAIQQRLVMLLINESARCLGEQVVTEAWMVDLAMVLGTGFAPFRGGPLRLADDWGLAHVIAHLEELWQQYGPRFAPCTELRKRAESGQRFHAEQMADNSPAAPTRPNI